MGPIDNFSLVTGSW